jgi:putative ABC transport system ATP-binding protein
MSRAHGKTVIIVTHNAALAGAADRTIRIKNGKIEEVIENPAPVAVSELNW